MIKHLVLIDSRINDKETIIRSLLETTFYIIVEYEIDTLDSIKDKINLLDLKSLDRVAIFQENYNMSTYNFVQSFNKSILDNVTNLDSELNTWTEFTSLLSYFKNTLNVLKIDLLGCNIYNNHNWMYVINKISMDLGITIQSSNDNTGSENLGGDWILESNNSNMIGIYFSEEIKKYKFVLGSVSYHTGYILNNGKVQMCGANWDGQLGNNSTTNSSVPVYMKDPNNPSNDLIGAVAISRGNSYTAILVRGGKVISCGANWYGQFGNNSTTNSSIPVYMKDPDNPTNDLTGAVAISCGYSHTAILLTNGKVISCGLNNNGQLGNNLTTTSKVPVYMKDPSNPTNYLTGALAICCGGYHTAVLVRGGKVISCGDNHGGQLGNNLFTNSSIPVYMKDPNNLINDLTGAVAISCGNYHTVILLNNGQIISCGDNYDGQLGNNSTVNNSSILVYMKDPDNLNYLSGAVAISCGGYHTCILLNNGKVISSGANYFGQLGNNLFVKSCKIPVYMKNPDNPINDLTGVVAISCGILHTTILLNDGKIVSCGDNSNGQFGINSILQSSISVYMKDPNNPVNDLTGATSIKCGYSHTAVILGGDKVISCGANWGGQLGNNSTTNSSIPVYMKNPNNSNYLSGAVAISCGNSHTTILLNDSRVVSCGANWAGQLGNNSINTSIPVYMKNPNNSNDLSGAIAISCGVSHSVILLNDGRVVSCGENYNGQLGNNSLVGNSWIPVYMKDPDIPTNNLTSAIAISCGGIHSAILVRGGKVISCGLNNFGQLGNNSTTNSKILVYMKDPDNPTNDLTGAVAISCGIHHTVVLLSTGKVISCGLNNVGQFGNNLITNSLIPVYMKDPDNPSNDLTGAIAISCGGDHTAVLVRGGKVISCGSNNSGQLGNNSIIQSSIPVYIINNSNLKIYSISEYNKCYYDYKVNNKNINQLKNSNYSISDLCICGFNAYELRIAGFTATELKEGFTATELKAAGFTATELKVARFTEYELLFVGFSIVDLIPEIDNGLKKSQIDLSSEVDRAKEIENELIKDVNKLNLLNSMWVQKTNKSK
jgi:alpha-tubulin suppressor-like RCC1 family protein